MPSVAFVVDAPTTLAEGEAPRSRIQVAELGSFWDPRYGDFEINGTMLSNWQKLLGSYFQGEISIDLDHSTDKPGGSSEAAGWIKGLDQLGADGQTRTPREVWATVEWTSLGADAVRDKRYRYVSPTFRDDLKDQKGKSLGPALLRAALTNNAFLRNMAAVSLAADTTFAERRPSPSPESVAVPDSRSAMDTVKLTKALGLPEDADEAKILAAVAERQPDDTRTLEQRAEAEGKVLLSQADHDALKTKGAKADDAIERIQTLETERATERFELAYKTALTEGRVHPAVKDGVDETKALHQATYEAAPEQALKLLASLPKQVNLSAQGSGGGAPGAAGPTKIDGYTVDEDRTRLLERAEAIATERKIDLVAAAQIAESEMAVA